MPNTTRARRGLGVGLIALAATIGTACSAASTSGATGPAPTTGSSPAASAAPGGSAAPPTTAAAGAPVPSKGCGTSKVGAVQKEKQPVSEGGADRFYLLTTPEDHDGHTPLPVVIDFHGLMEGAEIHATMTSFSELAQKEGFVAVFPHGSGSPVHWDVRADDANPDLRYFDAMIAKIKGDLCVDESRFYSTGLSYGAIMTSFLTCNRSELFAAVAPVDGVLPPNECPSTEHLPMLAFHGTADPLLPFNGGIGSAVTGLLGGKLPDQTTLQPPDVPYDLEGEGYPKAMRQWAARNGCEPTPTDTKVSKEVLRRVYTCPTGQDVEFVVVLGGGHTWSSSEFSKSIGGIVGYTSFEIDTSKEIWAFVKRFHR